MKESLAKLCDSFIENRDMLKSNFKLESMYITPVCAALLASKKVCPDADTFKNCQKLLKDNTGAFSNFRGYVYLPVISALATDSNPEEKIRKITEIYAILKKYFTRSQYLAYTASVLADMAEISEIDAIAERSKAIFKLMKGNHPFLTSTEDSTFAVLMAFCSQSNEELIHDIETCYSILRSSFSNRDAVQSMSHVIALAGGDVTANAQKAIALYDSLKASGRKYGKSYELAVLAALSVLPVDIETLTEEVLHADSFLAEQKGYGFWGLDKDARLMHAAMLVSFDYAESTAAAAAAITGTVAMVAAQQAALDCAIVAAAAASTAAD